jgi:hypothetical protein
MKEEMGKREYLIKKISERKKHKVDLEVDEVDLSH